jgi:hypothetical protein
MRILCNPISLVIRAGFSRCKDLLVPEPIIP